MVVALPRESSWYKYNLPYYAETGLIAPTGDVRRPHDLPADPGAAADDGNGEEDTRI